MAKRIVIVAGNIGVGKTSLAERLGLKNFITENPCVRPLINKSMVVHGRER